ncbi:MAG: hypothetical protein BWY28_02407 [bacterium ADurb.Bin236]|nr:MAG: hypothetical protein BWY28_02407 [bacterium ADurb.Bin236]
MPVSAWAMLCSISVILVGGLATFTIIALKKKK